MMLSLINLNIKVYMNLFWCFPVHIICKSTIMTLRRVARDFFEFKIPHSDGNIIRQRAISAKQFYDFSPKT